MSSSEAVHNIFEGSYGLPETKFAKELKDEMGDLTEEEHEEMSDWVDDYLLRDHKEKMKATKVREKRMRKTLRENPKSSSTRLSLTALRMKFWRRMTHLFRSCSSVLVG